MSVEKVLTTCVYCGTGCGLYLCVDRGKVMGIAPSRAHPVSQGRLCLKGWNAHQFVHHPQRLTDPLIKRNGTFAKASWDEALDLVAERLTEIKQRYGSDSLGVLSSAKCTNEENFVMMKFARAVLGTNNVDHCARLCHASTLTGLVKAFGSGAMTNSIAEIKDANVIFIIGSNTTEQHPVIAADILRAVDNGSKLVIIDPRVIHLSQFADMHLRLRPGTDVALMNGLMNVIIEEGLHNSSFIEERVEDFGELRSILQKYKVDDVAQITGVPVDDLRAAARLYARAEKATILYCMGITQHTTGTDNVLACANLAMLCGHVGREGTGVNPLRGHQNVQGACDMGALPNFYAGYQRVADEIARQKFEQVWRIRLPANVGLTVVEMMDAAVERKIKAMYIMGENPMVSDPNINQVKRALESLDFLVVQDIFLSETAELADVILPACSFAEKDGTFTSTERRVQRVRKAIAPIGATRPDWDIICDVARRMSYDMCYNSPEAIMEEVSTLAPIYGGIRYDRLDDFGLQWPCPTPDHPGTKYLHKNTFARGKGKFHAVDYLPPAEISDEQYPFVFTTGRIHYHFHSRTMTGRSEALNREAPEGYIEINPADAKELNIRHGGKVKVSSRRGQIITKAFVTEKVPPKTVFMPFNFGEAAANMLTNPALDPMAKIPEYKVCAIALERSD
ncbi:MAG: formate dehydrogenase subunit alpha [Chloroflexi bacterium]|nr:formate dehydrogenase subunit alpha [Chloroflexota bacterium]MCL5076098.1 formate dehydrogenase subunit alpha [Chloroflexota bacterium]